MNQWAKIAIEAVLLVALVLGAYYQIDGRVAMNEHRIGQELLGYENLVEELSSRQRDNVELIREVNTRLSRIEGHLGIR